MTFTNHIKKDRLLRTIVGISGCILALWNFWVIYRWFDFLGYTTSKENVLVILWICVGCIFVFLYSLFDGKGERYLRRGAQIALVMIIYWLMVNFIIFIVYQPQILMGISGIFVAFIGLSPSSKPNCRKFIVLAILFYAFLCIWFAPDHLFRQLGEEYWFDRRHSHSIFWGYPSIFCRFARNFRTHLEMKNLHFDEDQDITFYFKKYIFEFEYESMRSRHFRAEIISSILLRGGISLIVQEGQWYLRVNIPILLPHYTIINVPPDRKERLISLIRNEIARRARPEGGWPIFYDDGADTFDILIVVCPQR